MSLDTPPQRRRLLGTNGGFIRSMGDLYTARDPATATDHASDECQHSPDRSKEKGARHRGFDFSIVYIQRKLQDEKVAGDRGNEIATRAIQDAESDALQGRDPFA